MRKTALLLLIFALPTLGAGCSSHQQSKADAAKEWQKQPVPQDYLQRAKAMSQGPAPMVVRPGPPAAKP